MTKMFELEDFEDIRPYNDDEVNAALKRIVSNPLFDKILDFFFTGKDKSSIKESLSETYSSYAFQRNFIYPLVVSIVEKTSSGLTSDGVQQLNPDSPYLFVSNHRDIVLDSALLQLILHKNGHPTTEITFGSNLMVNQFVIDLGKTNRMFKVIRGGTKKELLKNSQLLSAYIRHTIVNKKVSIWIAQRPGRTKTGNDKTETGLLKMFSMSGKGTLEESFQELNIVPYAISYEYEPCCALKIKEVLTTSLTGTYQKSPDEDLKSIIEGITGYKGRIHASVGNPLNDSLHLLKAEPSPNDKINRIVKIIDSEIYRNYKLWPNNYIAWDMLNNSEKFRHHYTNEEKKIFLEYKENEIRGIPGDRKMIDDLFLKIYANPVSNALPLIPGNTDVKAV